MTALPVRVPTVIVGGSAAGLAVARCLQEARQEALVLEATDTVGTQWRSAYDRLHLHTPANRSGLPFQPMPADYPRYPSRVQVVTYLADYAAQLRQPPAYGVRVTAIERGDGAWVTRTTRGDIASDNIVVATGNASRPVVPVLPGAEQFGGRIVHSSAYRSGAAYRGQRVLVVGFGNSAAEIAIDLHEQGAQPTLAVRGAVNVIPREFLGIPVASLGLLQKLLPARVIDVLNAALCRVTVGDIRALGLRKLPYGPAVEIREHGHIPVIDVGTLALIRSGGIALRTGVARLVPGGAVFADGREEPFAAIVLGTGYRPGLETLLAAVPGVLDGRGSPLTRGGAGAVPGLYFCGFRIVPGGTLREIGREARRIATLIAAPGRRG